MLADYLVGYLVFLFSTTCHEFAHAFVALKGGDTTAYEGGQVSLDPTPHIRRAPFGMIVVPIASLAVSGYMVGWGASPYNPFWATRHPRRYGLMSLAGPTANIVLAFVAFVLIVVLAKNGVLIPNESAGRFGTLVLAPGDAQNTPLGALAQVLSQLFLLNVVLALFNLLPLPPLDGAGVVEGFWPRGVGAWITKARETPMFGLLGLLVAMYLVAKIPIRSTLANLIDVL
jgi:Zn-dependent protease